MTHLELITIMFAASTCALALACGALMNTLRLRDKELDSRAERHNSVMDELTQTQTERAKALQAKEEADKLRDRIERAAKVVEKDRDIARTEAMQFAADLNTMQAERANLYFRNSKGQIEPITPKERKPHTLKHGMTVKEPSPYQAKRIFAAAKRAGIETHQSATNDTNCIWFYGNDRVNSVCAAYAGAAMTTYISARFITAREFLRRIKGEIE
jgi:hypothetical protein